MAVDSERAWEVARRFGPFLTENRNGAGRVAGAQSELGGHFDDGAREPLTLQHAARQVQLAEEAEKAEITPIGEGLDEETIVA